MYFGFPLNLFRSERASRPKSKPYLKFTDICSYSNSIKCPQMMKKANTRGFLIFIFAQQTTVARFRQEHGGGNGNAVPASFTPML